MIKDELKTILREYFVGDLVAAIEIGILEDDNGNIDEDKLLDFIDGKVDSVCEVI